MLQLREWVGELLALAGSAAMLGIMVGLLAYYDGRQIFDLDNYGITLNAIVSLLATLCKGLLATAIDKSVGQWKWLLFSREPARGLVEFDQIDEASRGAQGSLSLLCRYRGPGKTLRAAAIVTVLAVALDPLAQQLVQLDQVLKLHTTPGQSATAPWASRYSKGFERASSILIDPYRGGPLHVNVRGFPDFNLEAAVLFGLSATEEQVLQQLQTHCPGGNCTWHESFDSLAVCSRCEDVGSQLTTFGEGSNLAFWLDKLVAGTNTFLMSMNGTAYQLPSGHFITNQDGLKPGKGPFLVMTSYGTSNPANSTSFKNLDTMIWSFSVLRHRDMTAAWSAEEPPEAVECALYYCVNNYNSKVVDSRNQQNVSEVADARRLPGSWNWSDPSHVLQVARPKDPLLSAARAQSIEFDPMFSFVHRTDLSIGMDQAGVEERRFNLSQVAVDSISAYFQSSFKYNATAEESGDTFTLMKPISSDEALPRETGLFNGFVIQVADSSPASQPSHLQAIYGSPDLSDRFQTLASSMSNAIRQGDDNGTTAQGEFLHLVVVYDVVWPWIIPHAFLIVSAAALLLITMTRTRPHKYGVVPVWKSSALAALSRGPAVAKIFTDVWTLRGSASVAELKKRAAGARVLLGPEETEMTHLDDNSSSSFLVSQGTGPRGDLDGARSEEEDARVPRGNIQYQSLGSRQ